MSVRYGDDHEHQRRRDGPGDFERAVMGGPGGDRIRPLVEPPDAISEQRRNQDRYAEDRRHQNVVMEPLDSVLDRRIGRQKPHLARDRGAQKLGFRGNRRRDRENRGSGKNSQCPSTDHSAPLDC